MRLVSLVSQAARGDAGAVAMLPVLTPISLAFPGLWAVTPTLPREWLSSVRQRSAARPGSLAVWLHALQLPVQLVRWCRPLTLSAQVLTHVRRLHGSMKQTHVRVTYVRSYVIRGSVLRTYGLVRTYGPSLLCGLT
jgi:hypothetical protein